MAWRSWFYRFWYRLFSQPFSSPLTGGNEEIEITLYQSQSLTENFGRNPERTVARYIAENFDRADIGYRITFGYKPKNPPDEVNNPPLSTLIWWTDEEREHTAEDANLLLLNINGGGISYRYGRFGLAPAGNIDKDENFSPRGTTDLHRNVRACLHELAHNLSVGHEDGIFTPPSMIFSLSAVRKIGLYVQRNR